MNITAVSALLRNRVLTNTLVQFVTPAVRTVLGLALTAVLSRHLGVVGFGEYGLVLAYVTACSGIFNEWGLGTILLREISRQPEQRDRLLASGAALQLVIALGSYGLMIGGLLLFRYPPAVNWSIGLYGLTLLLMPLDILALSFQADLRLSRLLAPSLLGTLLHFALSVAALLITGSLVALIAAALMALIVQYVWLARLSLGPLRFKGWPSMGYWGWFLHETWPVALATVLTTAQRQMPVLMLSLFSAEAVGLFSAANRIPQQVLLIPFAVRASVFPLLSQSWVTDRAQFARLLDRFVSMSLLISIPLVILSIGLAVPVTQLLFGSAFTAAATPFALLMAVSGLLFPGILIGEALAAAGAQRVTLVMHCASTPLLILLLFALIPTAGATGAAWAVLLCYVTVVAATFVAAHWCLGVASSLERFTPGVFGAISGGLSSAIAWPLSPVISGIVGAVVALAIMLLFESTAAPAVRSRRLFLRAKQTSAGALPDPN